MKIVKEFPTKEGGVIQFWSDDDSYLSKTVLDTSGEIVSEETLWGECACEGCCENRDWEELI